MNATRHDLEIQFRRVVQNGWLAWFQREAKRAGTTTAHLLGIGSRETNLKNIRGDFRGGQYHGFGVMQVDIGTDPGYARHWTPQNVEPSIVRGIDIYLGKVADIRSCVGRRSIVRGRSFTGKPVDPEDLRRIATAAYNCGRWAHYHFSRGENVDSTTTGHDYSRDVYDRAVEFADLLTEGGYEKQATYDELSQQGKYARNEHVKRFYNEGPRVTQLLPSRLQLPLGESQEAEDELAATDYERDSEAISDNEIGQIFDGIGQTSTDTGPAGSQASPPNEPALNPVELPESDLDANSLRRDNASASVVGEPSAPGSTQIAENIVNTGDKVVPDNFVPGTKAVDAPPKEGSVATSTTMTIGGFAVPGILVTVISAVKQFISDGYVSAQQVGDTVIGFITNNQKYFFGLVGLIIALLMLKKTYKQITLWVEMWIKADPNRHDVEVKKQ